MSFRIHSGFVGVFKTNLIRVELREMVETLAACTKTNVSVVQIVLNLRLELFLLLVLWLDKHVLDVATVNIYIAIYKLVHVESIFLSIVFLVQLVFLEQHHFVLAIGILKIVIIWKIKPWMLKHFLRGYPSFVVPIEHRQQKVRERLRFILLNAVLFNQYLL